MSLTFNGKRPPSFLRITDIQFDAIGDISIVERERKKAPGSRFVRSKRGGRYIEVTAVIEGGGVMEKAIELKEWLKGDDWKESRLAFDKVRDKHMMAVVSSQPSISDLFNYGETAFTFYAAEPFFFADRKAGMVWEGSSPVGGNNILFRDTLENRGLEACALNIHAAFTADVTWMRITNETTNAVFYVTTESNSGTREITVNGERKSAVYTNWASGNQMGKIRLDSKWVTLKKGMNWIKVEAGFPPSNGATPFLDGIITFDYQERY